MSRHFHCTLLLLLAPVFVIAQKAASRDYLVSFTDPATETCGYKNRKGEVVIPARYTMCFTDTLHAFAVVLEPEIGLMAIDRNGKDLYEVFVFDNGPDPASEGLFRIIIGGKFGFADINTGQIVITPQFDAVFPFENGKARAGMNCKTEYDGEHSNWTCSDWIYINKTGNQVAAPGN